MKIPGIGNVTKAELLSVMTVAEKQKAEFNQIDTSKIGRRYKATKAREISKYGDSALFSLYYKRIPETIVEKLNIEELAALVDSYGGGY